MSVPSTNPSLTTGLTQTPPTTPVAPNNGDSGGARNTLNFRPAESAAPVPPTRTRGLFAEGSARNAPSRQPEGAKGFEDFSAQQRKPISSPLLRVDTSGSPTLERARNAQSGDEPSGLLTRTQSANSRDSIFSFFSVEIDNSDNTDARPLRVQSPRSQLEGELAILESEHAEAKATLTDVNQRVRVAMDRLYDFHKEAGAYDIRKEYRPVKSTQDFLSNASVFLSRGKKAVSSLFSKALSPFKAAPEPQKMPELAKFDNGHLITVDFTLRLEAEVEELEARIEDIRGQLNPEPELEPVIHLETHDEMVARHAAEAFAAQEDRPEIGVPPVTRDIPAATVSDDTPPPVPPRVKKEV